MATPRSQLVDDQHALHYHIVSRCVRQSWLCGVDRLTGRDYTHRKRQLIRRMRFLAQHFSVDVPAYVVMSNHFHLVVYYDPMGSCHWSDEEVAHRWVEVCPPRCRNPRRREERAKEHRLALLADPSALLAARTKLSSLSTFMKFLKQSVSRSANREDRCSGHFFESRFYSGALLDEASVVAAMAYVDLNPVRARIAASIEEIEHASIEERLKAEANDPEALARAVMPLVGGLSEEAPRLEFTLKGYIDLLTHLIQEDAVFEPKEQRWRERLTVLGKRQRAYGSAERLKKWAEQRGWKRCGIAMA